MFHLSRVNKLSMAGQISRLVTRNSRPASGQAGGGVVKIAGGSLLVTVVCVGGTVAWAGLDQFRQVVEENVPGSDKMMEIILGKETPGRSAPDKLKISPSAAVSTPVLDEEKTEKNQVPPQTVQSYSAPPPPQQTLGVTTAMEGTPVAAEASTEPAKGEVETLTAVTEDEVSSPHDMSLTTNTDIENTSLETVLSELCKEMKTMVEIAVNGYQVASNRVANHINIMQEVLETNMTGKDEAAWNKMFEAAVAKSDATKCAEIKEKGAVAAIDNVIEVIATGRKNKATSTNPELLVAEETANRAIALLEQTKAQGAAVQSDAKVMEEYRDLVEAGRKQFHKEMVSIMPDVKLGEKTGKLSEDELNMFITHAYKKVLHLQQELAKQQTLEQERFKKALHNQKVEIQMLGAEKIEEELVKQARKLEIDHMKRMNIIKEDAERDIRAQLTRQAAAHSDHLQDLLGVQEAELKRKHEHSLSEKLSNTKSDYLESLSSLSGTVSGLCTSLQARDESEQKAVEAQQFWLACTGLEAALDTLKPLMGEVTRVKTVATPGDSFVQVLVASLSPLALDRGVYSVDSLKERFCVVEKKARQVARIGEEGGSLLSYGLSYLQAILTVDLSQRSPVEEEDKVDLSNTSTSDLLSMAKHSLDKDNLARTIQYMTLLKGEPSRVVEDWLAEARLTMETRQAALALLTHALVEGVDSL